MKLSVIIPCYNAEKTIGSQLEALACQCWREPWEVIVADNGSTDGTAQVCRRFEGRLANLRLIEASDRRGAGHARNVGVRAAKASCLAFCDADDVVGDGWVEAMGNGLAEYPFVASRFEARKLNDESLIRLRRCPQEEGLQLYTYPPFLPHSGGSGLGIRREAHEAVGGFDETMLRLQDTDYCWRVQLAGYPLQFLPEAVLHMRMRQETSDILKQARMWGMYNVLLYKKYQARGMPSITLRQGLRTWLGLLRSYPGLKTEDERMHWRRLLAWRIGRIQGCLKYRVIAF